MNLDFKPCLMSLRSPEPEKVPVSIEVWSTPFPHRADSSVFLSRPPIELSYDKEDTSP